MGVETVIEDARWDAADLGRLAERAVAATLRHQGLDPAEWDVAVLGCDDGRIAALNSGFRGRERATNVLSWPSAERGAAAEGARPAPPDPGAPELGDIAIAYDTAAAEAGAAGLAFADHVTHLLVHATLHLLGYDHERNGDGDLMETAEIAILAGLGVSDPYGGGGA